MLKKIMPKWDIDEAICVLWVSHEATVCFLKNFRKIHGYGITKHLAVFYPDGFFRWCTPYQENIDLGQNLILKMVKDKKYLLAVTRGFKKYYKNAFNYFKKIDNLNLKKISNKELFRRLKKLQIIYRDIWLYGFTIEPIDEVLPKLLEKEMAKYNLREEEKIILTEVPDKTFANKEKEDLLKIALKIIKLGLKNKFKKNINEIKKLLQQSSIYKDIKKHWKKYKWLLSGHAGKKEIKGSFFVKELKEYLDSNLELEKEIKKIRNYVPRIIKEKKKIIRKYNFRKKLLTLSEIIDKWGPIHDMRKKWFLNSVYYIESFLEEIGKRHNFTLKELRRMMLDEVLDFEKGKIIDRKKLNKRMGLTVEIFNREKFRFYTREKAKEIEKKEIQDMFKEIKEASLVGMCGNLGKVKGKIKIIYNPKEMKEMKKGNILVTSMTRPELVPALKLAAAIVTDEGGITCHAAIVARELNIPCIIGTKIATKVLKDGDEVEVDANKGIVKKLSFL